MSASTEQERTTIQHSGEMAEPRWSVVSFERLEAGGLTYDDARRKLDELDSQNVAGLCIVTDEAAARLKRR